MQMRTCDGTGSNTNSAIEQTLEVPLAGSDLVEAAEVFHRRPCLQDLPDRIEARLRLFLKDPSGDRLCDPEEPAWVDLEDLDNPGSATFVLITLGDLALERLVKRVGDSAVGLVLDYLQSRLDLPTKESQ